MPGWFFAGRLLGPCSNFMRWGQNQERISLRRLSASYIGRCVTFPPRLAVSLGGGRERRRFDVRLDGARGLDLLA